MKGPDHAPFDLTMSKTSENQRIIVAIEMLKVCPGWHFMVQVMQENLKVLENCIINKVDMDGNPITDEQADSLRFRRAYVKELLEKPDAFLKDLTRMDEGKEDLDPYERGENS